MGSADKLSKIILNPVRMRIIQFLMIHGRGTASQFKEALLDVPVASLYRHIKVLEEAQILLVASETRIRGAVEKTYELNHESPLGETPSNGNALQLINSTLIEVMASFNRYFVKEDAKPMEDMLFVSSSTLLLSDDEYEEVLKKIGLTLSDAIQNKPSKARKVRRLTLVSSPADDE